MPTITISESDRWTILNALRMQVSFWQDAQKQYAGSFMETVAIEEAKANERLFEFIENAGHESAY